MHKKIVQAIREAITQDDRNTMFRVFVNEKDTDGFWEMIIVVNPKYKHLIPHIQVIGHSIGKYYGEGLHINVWNNTIEFS